MFYRKRAFKTRSFLFFFITKKKKQWTKQEKSVVSHLIHLIEGLIKHITPSSPLRPVVFHECVFSRLGSVKICPVNPPIEWWVVHWNIMALLWQYPLVMSTVCYWKWWFIVDFPIDSMVIFHSYVNVSIENGHRYFVDFPIDSMVDLSIAMLCKRLPEGIWQYWSLSTNISQELHIITIPGWWWLEPWNGLWLSIQLGISENPNCYSLPPSFFQRGRYIMIYMAVCQNLVPLVNIKIAGKWMFIPLKMVLIGIDPYPYTTQVILVIFEDPGGIKHAPCPTVWSPRKAPLWSPASRRDDWQQSTGVKSGRWWI